jgi:hypothetical protein
MISLILKKNCYRGYLRSGGGVNQYMAGLITSLLELGLEEKLLDILVKTFKVILIHII